jgi:hypothetical protein
LARAATRPCVREPSAEEIRTPEERAELVEGIAVRVVELLLEDAPAIGSKPLTVAEVAKLIGRSEDYVRVHRGELGALPTNGVRPRILLDAEAVRRFMRARRHSR